jgi:hypothetical protein
MLLEGRLSHTFTLAQLAGHPFRHDLPRLWRAFPALDPAEDLRRFDPLIDRLGRRARRSPSSSCPRAAGAGATRGGRAGVPAVGRRLGRAVPAL